MKQEEFFELCANKTCEDLKGMYDILFQSIRSFLSRNLMETSEEHPLECEIAINVGAQGISECMKPHIIAIYQEPCDGTIWVKGDDGFSISEEYISIEDLSVEELLDIVEYFG